MLTEIPVMFEISLPCWFFGRHVSCEAAMLNRGSLSPTGFQTLSGMATTLVIVLWLFRHLLWSHLPFANVR